MPRPGGGSIGHRKHRQAFGRAVAGPKARMNRKIELMRDEEARRETHNAGKPKMFPSVETLFRNRDK